MTAIERTHLTYPSVDRLRERLADAKADHLILYNVTRQDHDWNIVTWRASCTPTQGMDEYRVMAYWISTDDRVHTHCTCTAGGYGLACKHGALLLESLGLLSSAVRVMSAEEYQKYETLALLPAWRKEDESAT